MSTQKILFWTFCLLSGIPNVAIAIPFNGIEFPDGSLSFADAVVSYTPNSSDVGSYYSVPTKALGTPDYYHNDGVAEGIVSLGTFGELVLQFVDNSLTTSGDSSFDLWVFEAGWFESTAIEISANGLDWVSVGSTSEATSGIDIDSYIGAGVILGEQYSYVKIIDLDIPLGQSLFPWAGADIDAVGAISSISAIPEPAVVWLFGSGLIGLVALAKRKQA